jgi:hypothetical protein
MLKHGSRWWTMVAGALCALLLTTAIALAGAPLKGVDVKLGRNPGGSPAMRMITTGADGKADFGSLPAGSYWVVIGGSAASAGNVRIEGAAGGQAEWAWDADKITFETDGTHPIVISATTVVKSKSNITNN